MRAVTLAPDSTQQSVYAALHDAEREYYGRIHATGGGTVEPPPLTIRTTRANLDAFIARLRDAKEVQYIYELSQNRTYMGIPVIVTGE